MNCMKCGDSVDTEAMDIDTAKEFAISGLCWFCQLEFFDPVLASSKCCGYHDTMNETCLGVTWAGMAEYDDRMWDEAGLMVFTRTKDMEREIEALSFEGLPWEYFDTDVRWLIETNGDAAVKQAKVRAMNNLESLLKEWHTNDEENK